MNRVAVLAVLPLPCLGWLGPRGLASIPCVLLILDETAIVHRRDPLAITVLTVALSALLHGVIAAPYARRYGRLAEQMGECEEDQVVSELPLRDGPMRRDDNRRRTETP